MISFFKKLKKKYAKNSKQVTSIEQKKGFTLFEIFIALALVSVFFSSVFALMSKTTRLQKEAEDLTVATHLAQQIMETIKNGTDESSQDFPLEGFPNFSASYSIEDGEYDLAKLAADAGQDIETATGAILDLTHYQVVITYANNKTFVLDFYRGEEVKENNEK